MYSHQTDPEALAEADRIRLNVVKLETAEDISDFISDLYTRQTEHWSQVLG